MSIITRMRKQTCVYWALASSDSAGEDFDDYGQPQWSEPVEISCRWEDVSEEFVDAKGDKQASRSIVYVDRNMRVGEVLMLGVSTDVVDGDNVLEKNADAWEIRKFDKIPNLKASEFLRMAFL